MRVTPDVITRQVLRDITSTAARMQALQGQISSGKRIEKASDDPVSMTRVLALRGEKAELERYKEGANSGMEWLDATSSRLSAIENALLEIIDLGNQGANALMDQEAKQALSDQVNEYLKEMIDLSNSTLGGKYLFAGTQTLTAPFEGEDLNADGLYDLVNQVNPDSIDEPINRAIGKDQTLGVNSAGGALFQPDGVDVSGDVFKAIIDLRDALAADDVEEIKAQCAQLEETFDRVVNENSVVGAKINRLQATLDRLDVDILNATGRISELEDTDFVKASLEYQSKQNIYQASLDIGSKLIQLSLLDYL